MVNVTLNGRGEMRKIKIDPSLADPDEMRSSRTWSWRPATTPRPRPRRYLQDEMGKLTGGLPLPPGFKLPF